MAQSDADADFSVNSSKMSQGRLRRWLQKSNNDKLLSIIHRIQASIVKLSPSLILSGNRFFYISYQPDSHFNFQAHPEYEALRSSFTKNNKGSCADTARLWSFILNIKHTIADGVTGDFAELGVHMGNSASVLAHYANSSGRKLFLLDTFEGFDARDLTGVDAGVLQQFTDTSIEKTKEVIGNPSLESCVFIKGFFPESITPELSDSRFSIVSLDCDLYEPTKAGLEFFYPRMNAGGLILLHDYSSLYWSGVKNAIDEFCKANGVSLVLLPDKSGSAVIRKPNC